MARKKDDSPRRGGHGQSPGRGGRKRKSGHSGRRRAGSTQSTGTGESSSPPTATEQPPSKRRSIEWPEDKAPGEASETESQKTESPGSSNPPSSSKSKKRQLKIRPRDRVSPGSGTTQASGVQKRSSPPRSRPQTASTTNKLERRKPRREQPAQGEDEDEDSGEKRARLSDEDKSALRKWHQRFHGWKDPRKKTPRGKENILPTHTGYTPAGIRPFHPGVYDVVREQDPYRREPRQQDYGFASPEILRNTGMTDPADDVFGPSLSQRPRDQTWQGGSHSQIPFGPGQSRQNTSRPSFLDPPEAQIPSGPVPSQPPVGAVDFGQLMNQPGPIVGMTRINAISRALVDAQAEPTEAEARAQRRARILEVSRAADARADEMLRVEPLVINRRLTGRLRRPHGRRTYHTPIDPILSPEYPGTYLGEGPMLQGGNPDPVEDVPEDEPSQAPRMPRSHLGTNVFEHGSPMQRSMIPITPQLDMDVLIGSHSDMVHSHCGHATNTGAVTPGGENAQGESSSEPEEFYTPGDEFYTPSQEPESQQSYYPEDSEEDGETPNVLQAMMARVTNAMETEGNGSSSAPHKANSNSCRRCIMMRIPCRGGRPCRSCRQSNTPCADAVPSAIDKFSRTAGAAHRVAKRPAPAYTGGPDTIRGRLKKIQKQNHRDRVTHPQPCKNCDEAGNGDACDADHTRKAACSSCTSMRARGLLSTACKVGRLEYVPQRHAATAYRYNNVQGAIVYCCDGCESTPVKSTCDIDPRVKVGCTTCCELKRKCVFTPDRRSPGHNQIKMLRRPSSKELNHDPGAEHLSPWWRRACEHCSETTGTKCSWLLDYRRMQYKCNTCARKNIPCVDAEDDGRVVSKVWTDEPLSTRQYVPGFRITRPEITSRIKDPGPCVACEAVKPFVAKRDRIRGGCVGLHGAEDYACLRCTAFGIPCAVREKDGVTPKVLPVMDRKLIGYGIDTDVNLMQFEACGRCSAEGRACDRMRPCHHCEREGEECIMADVKVGLGHVPKETMDLLNLQVGEEYWMAMGYGGVGPGGIIETREGVDEFQAVGPTELTWQAPEKEADIKQTTTPSSSHAQSQQQQQKPARDAPAIGDGPATPLLTLRAPQDAPNTDLMDVDQPVKVVEPEISMVFDEFKAPISLPNTSINIEMGGFDHGFDLPTVSRTRTSSSNSSGLYSTPEGGSSTSSNTTSLGFNDRTQCFNVLQPQGQILGSELGPFSSTPRKSFLGSSRSSDRDQTDVFGDMKRFEEAMEDQSIVREIREYCQPKANERFVQVHLAHHAEIDFHPDADASSGFPVPPSQHPLLTLQGQDPSVHKKHPYAPPWNPALVQDRIRHLLTKWKAPSLDVLRDISSGSPNPHPSSAAAQCTGRAAHGTGRCVHSAPPSSLCSNLQHMRRGDPAPVTCDACDDATVEDVLAGPGALTASDIFFLRTYACRDCARPEFSARGVVAPAAASLLTGCPCASKLLRRRLCAGHRYALAAALFINAAFVREWILVNFRPGSCLFCRQPGKIVDPNAPGVFFCANCQIRVIDSEPYGRELFAGRAGAEDRSKRDDAWGAKVVSRMMAKQWES